MDSQNITYIDQANITGKRVLLRVDFNVTLTPEVTIADDARIRQSLPTIQYLLRNHNKLILVSHLGRPKGVRDEKYSLKVVAQHLETLVPGYKVRLVDDFLTDSDGAKTQKENEILMLENIRFYPEEKKGDTGFAKKLASLADVYVNDAFGVAHRSDASLVAVTEFLPSYGGLLLKAEVETFSRLLKQAQKPFVAIIGGAKIADKLNLITKLVEIADYLVLGGGIANTFLLALGYPIGKSLAEPDQIEEARKLMFLAAQKRTAVILPEDVVTAKDKDGENGGHVHKIEEVPEDEAILDIGPGTQANIGSIIHEAKTIVWNGPVGYSENKQFARGTDYLYYAITHNGEALTVVGGGDTLAAISKKEYLDKISHISTGGGAMLEFIELGTLPAIEALKGKGNA